jgi:hypothetical protein
MGYRDVVARGPLVQTRSAAGTGNRTEGYGKLSVVKLFAACALLGLIAAGGSAACGPSFQAVYECDVHFEHCYALDQGSASVEAKKECWRDWLHGYTYGQSRDRIEYGGTRLSQLSLDPTLPSEDVRSEGRKRTIAAPVPTNAFAPPPNMIEGHDPAGPPPDDAVAIHAPGADCADSCKQRWTTCHLGCRGASCGSCDDTYRACMPDCFRQDPLPTRSAAPPASAVKAVR